MKLRPADRDSFKLMLIILALIIVGVLLGQIFKSVLKTSIKRESSTIELHLV